MPKYDLNAMPLADLKKLQKDISNAITNFDTRHKATVMSALEEKAKEFGYALSDIFTNLTGTRKPRKQPLYRYANPTNPSISWSGMGRKPKWFADAVEAGRTPESMKV